MKYVKPERLTEQSLILDVRTPDEIREEALSLPFFNEELSKLNPRDFVYEHNLDGSKTLNIITKLNIIFFMIYPLWVIYLAGSAGAGSALGSMVFTVGFSPFLSCQTSSIILSAAFSAAAAGK